MADLNQNIDMTKLKESYKWSGGVARKGIGLSPKEDKSGLRCGKEDGCSLSSIADGSGVWKVLLVWPWPRPS
jgi:hypothetical protein